MSIASDIPLIYDKIKTILERWMDLSAYIHRLMKLKINLIFYYDRRKQNIFLVINYYHSQAHPLLDFRVALRFERQRQYCRITKRLMTKVSREEKSPNKSNLQVLPNFSFTVITTLAVRYVC